MFNIKTNKTIKSFALIMLSLIYSPFLKATAEVEIVLFEPLLLPGADRLTYIVHNWDLFDQTPSPPECRVKACDYGVAWQVGNPSSGATILEAVRILPGGAGTMGMVAKIYKEKYPFGIRRTITGGTVNASGSKVCFGMKFRPSDTYTVQIVPGSYCTNLTPTEVNNYCYTENATINHNSFSPGMRNIATSQISFRCLNPSTVNISMPQLATDNTLELKRVNSSANSNLRARLTLNGRAAKQGVNFNASGNRITDSISIESELVAIGSVESGNYQGSSIIIVNIP
nr:hypothetical protein [uncultured Moellerella sp.]